MAPLISIMMALRAVPAGFVRPCARTSSGRASGTRAAGGGQAGPLQQFAAAERELEIHEFMMLSARERLSSSAQSRSA